MKKSHSCPQLFHVFFSCSRLLFGSAMCLFVAVSVTIADTQRLPVKVRNPKYKLVDGKRFQDKTAKTNAVEIITYALSIDADAELYMSALRRNLLHKIEVGDIEGAIALLDSKSRSLATRKPAPKFKKQK